MQDPARDGALPYDEAVREWHEKRVDLWETTVETELADGQVGGFLAWGDPAFYDSTLRILEAVRTRGTFDFDASRSFQASAPFRPWPLDTGSPSPRSAGR